VLVAARLTARPIELPYLATLPVEPVDARRAKRAYLIVWASLYPLLGVPALALRLDDGVWIAAAVVGMIAAAVIAGDRTLRY